MSPIIKSAKKALRQSKKRNVLNVRTKNKMKKIVKGLRVFVEEKKIEDAKKILPKAYKAVDKAAKRGVIKKNTASRKKSRLTKAINKISEIADEIYKKVCRPKIWEPCFIINHPLFPNFRINHPSNSSKKFKMLKFLSV